MAQRVRLCPPVLGLNPEHTIYDRLLLEFNLTHHCESNKKSVINEGGLSSPFFKDMNSHYKC